MTGFTPLSALLGGALIGAAAVLLMATNGRIAGVSGIVDGALAPVRDGDWRLAFVAGLLAAPILYALASGALPQVSYPHAIVWMIIGGFLVGFGARLGSGCTSGHGVCGLARLSARSLAATATFMATAAMSVFLLHRL